MKGVRILVDIDDIDDIDLADEFGVCIGLERVRRGAWWQLVSTHADGRAANRAFEAIDRRRGRALVLLQHEDIAVLDLAGKPLAVSS